MSDQALEKGTPPEFPLDASLLPACRSRVRLAVRLDAQLRSKSKSGAEDAWLRRNAEAAGIQLSDDEDADGDGRAGPRGGDGASGDGSSAEEIQRVRHLHIRMHLCLQAAEGLLWDRWLLCCVLYAFT